MNQDLKKIRLIIVGAKDQIKQSIESLLADHSDIEILMFIDTGSEGIQKINELKPDIALIDIATPDIDSVEVVRLIRASSPEVKTILMSLATNPDWARRGREAGVSDFVSQPFYEDDLYYSIQIVYQRQ